MAAVFFTLTSYAQQSAAPVVLSPNYDHISGSVYISMDSWIYPAMERLYGLGYIDTAFLGLRPWTRLSCLHMLQETQARIFDDAPTPGNLEARQLFDVLAKELYDDRDALDPNRFNGHAELDRLYAGAMYIAGRPLNDSAHFGSTLINDYGRAYEGGFNALAGFSARAEDVRLSLKVRGEYHQAPSRAAYPLSVRQTIATMDHATLLPPIPVDTTNEFRLIDATLSYHILNHEISVGKTENWWGPGEGGAMAWSINAEPIYEFSINRVEPLQIPLLSRLLGPFRYQFIFGDLKGHRYPNAPWVHAQKINFKPTRNLEFGFSRVVVFAGEGHVPLTFGSFWNSFTSFQNVPHRKSRRVTIPARVTPASTSTTGCPSCAIGSRCIPTRSFTTMCRRWMLRATPLSTRASISRTFRALRSSTSVPKRFTPTRLLRAAIGGTYIYWESVYKDVYTNKGYMFGNWIGREGKGYQGWLTYWLSPQESIQLSYRNAKSAKDFVPGGTTQNLVAANAIVRVKKDLELNALAQYERWTVPVLAPGRQSDFTTSVQMTWYPHLRVGH